MASDINMFCLILITIFIPPLGVLIIKGCGADFVINILLTILGYFPGHIHAFYLEYMDYKHKEEIAKQSQYVQQQPMGQGAPVSQAPYGQAPYAQQQQPQQQQAYGTV